MSLRRGSSHVGFAIMGKVFIVGLCVCLSPQLGSGRGEIEFGLAKMDIAE